MFLRTVPRSSKFSEVMGSFTVLCRSLSLATLPPPAFALAGAFAPRAPPPGLSDTSKEPLNEAIALLGCSLRKWKRGGEGVDHGIRGGGGGLNIMQNHGHQPEVDRRSCVCVCFIVFSHTKTSVGTRGDKNLGTFVAVKKQTKNAVRTAMLAVYVGGGCRESREPQTIHNHSDWSGAEVRDNSDVSDFITASLTERRYVPEAGSLLVDLGTVGDTR